MKTVRLALAIVLALHVATFAAPSAIGRPSESATGAAESEVASGLGSEMGAAPELGERKVKASRPLRRSPVPDGDGIRGGQSRTAAAIARIWAGVVPQHPPTMFSQPADAHSASCGARLAGVSGNPVSERGSGKPAFG